MQAIASVPAQTFDGFKAKAGWPLGSLAFDEVVISFRGA